MQIEKRETETERLVVEVGRGRGRGDTRRDFIGVNGPVDRTADVDIVRDVIEIRNQDSRPCFLPDFVIALRAVQNHGSSGAVERACHVA